MLSSYNFLLALPSFWNVFLFFFLPMANSYSSSKCKLQGCCFWCRLSSRHILCIFSRLLKSPLSLQFLPEAVLSIFWQNCAKSCVCLNPQSLSVQEMAHEHLYKFHNEWIIADGELRVEKNGKLLFVVPSN
jgi:hypothetical protein